MKKIKNKKPNVRLLAHVTPIEYKLLLKPDLEAHTFEGNEEIQLSLSKPTKEITLHSKDLKIADVSIKEGKEITPATNISYDTEAETATFTFPKNIKKGKLKLVLSFAGVLSDNMRGFYKSQYVLDGKTHTIATTQFEATDARRALPCFDEPTHKAVFHVKLIIPSDKVAISNTLPSEVAEHEAGFKIFSFDPTPKMSTYLLAFIVGDFEFIEGKTKDGVLVRIFTTPGKKHQGKFALDVTIRTLEFYDDYFDIPYPLNTLDMIAIPDFSSLAMENWGAITFREIGLLVDEEHTSSASREMVAEVIAHELAHQWFGNLVTMEWWTHLWLNEGFASYIPYLALDHLFPEWNMWDRFATDTLAIALKLDALTHTHPIEIEVHHPDEIGEIFDAVSYSKGAAVIRMLAEYLGEKDFRAGLVHYLKKHSYKNASTVHLWDAFEKVSGKPVKKMMAIWTGKGGYPLVSVAKSGEKITLSQKRYFSSITSAKKSKDTTLWPIPLSVVTSKGEKNIALFSSKKTVLDLPNEGWFKLNPHEGSLYRTSYDSATLDALKKPIMEGRLSATDRLGIIRDLFALAEAGETKTTHTLEIVQIYKSETEYIVWVEIVSGLRYIANLMRDSKSYESFRSFARTILSDAVELVGWEPRTGETHTDALMRSLILAAAAYFGDANVIKEAKKRFKNHQSDPILADLRGLVYSTVAREGDAPEYKKLLAMFRKEKLHEEKNRLFSALGQFENKKLLAQTLDLIMSDEVRMQDRNSAFASVLVNPYGRELGWKFLKKNWKKVGEAYGEGNHLLARLIQVLNRYTTRVAYEDIKKFFKTHSAPSAKRTIDQTLEHIDSNIRWLARDGKAIEKWLKANK